RPYAAKGQVAYRHVQQGLVDPHAAGVGVRYDPLLLLPVVTEIVERQRTWPGIDIGNGLVDVSVGHHWQQGAEDLVLHDPHVVIHIQQQGRRQAAILALAEQGYHARAPSPGILQIAVEPRLLAGIDDAGGVRVVRQLRIEALDDAPVGFDKALDAVPGHQYIVGGNTGLAGIHGLAEGDALSGIFQGDVPGNDGRRLAAQLQGDGCQVVRRRMQDVPADAG